MEAVAIVVDSIILVVIEGDNWGRNADIGLVDIRAVVTRTLVDDVSGSGNFRGQAIDYFVRAEEKGRKIGLASRVYR